MANDSRSGDIRKRCDCWMLGYSAGVRWRDRVSSGEVVRCGLNEIQVKMRPKAAMDWACEKRRGRRNAADGEGDGDPRETTSWKSIKNVERHSIHVARFG